VVAIIGLGLLLTATTSDVTRVSEAGIKLVNDQPLLPESAGDWTGGEQSGLSEDERKILPADTEGARRLYTDKAGDQIQCSVVLAGRDVTSIHRPEYCLPGQGWNIQTEHVERIPVASAPGGTLGVMRMNAVRDVQLRDGRKAQARTIFVYWFVGKDRVTPHHWQRILWTTKDRVLHNTNHRWAYFLIYAPVTGDATAEGLGRSEKQTMDLVARFVQDIYPALASK
jgi:EpsI family protein